MKRYTRISVLILLATAMLGACNRMPEYASYIPKDAVAVAGVNLGSLSKKIAWNVITGSKIFKEMQKRIPEKNGKDMMSGIEKAGINTSSTFYVYVKSDNRFSGGNRITGLVPLSDAGQWEAYVKSSFPQAEIKEHGDHKEAALGKDMFVGWNKNMLIVTNFLSAAPTDGNNSSALAGMSAEMDIAFNVPKENPITTAKHFTDLGAEGHDVSFWLNYEQLMNQYSGDMADKMGGVSVSNKLWKDAAFACGFDFMKGKISGDMRYYLGDAVSSIGSEFGATNVDKDMLERLPGQNLDMLMAMHISPKGVKQILETSELLGLANVGLNQKNLTVDNVLDAFTGDMAIMMNDFSLRTETVTDNFMGQPVTHQNQKPNMSVSYVMKINKKDEFQKLVLLAKENGLVPIQNGYVVPLDMNDSIYFLMNDQYAVISNKFPYATGLLDGRFKSQKIAEPTMSLVSGHPTAMFFDIQQMAKNIDLGGSGHDSAMMAESRKLLSSASATGGEYKNSAMQYHIDINFTNQDENSIIQIMDYAMRISDMQKQGAE